MNVSEKVSRLANGSPAVARLGIPAYEWWSEALHGVAGSPGVNFTSSGDFSCATSFPEPIGLGATFDRELIRLIASTTSTEARAFSNVNRAGLDFWTPNSQTTHHTTQSSLSSHSSYPTVTHWPLPHLCPPLSSSPVVCGGVVQSTSSGILVGVVDRRLLVRTPTSRQSTCITSSAGTKRGKTAVTTR